MLEGIQKEFNSGKSDKKDSLTDLNVLAGGAGIERAPENGGHAMRAPFTPGRLHAFQAQTARRSMAALESIAHRLRKFQRARYSVFAEVWGVDRAQLHMLTAREMTC